MWYFITTHSAPWFPWMLDILLKSAALLAVAGVAVLVCWRASAALRHLIWTLAMLGVLLLPMLSATLPAWRVLHWSLGVPTQQMHTQVPEAAMPVIDPAVSGEPILPSGEPSPTSTTLTTRAESPTMASTSEQFEQPSQSAPPISPTPSRPYVPWPVWIILTWGTGTILLLAWTLYGYSLAHCLLRRAHPAPVAWTSEMPAGVRILMSDVLVVPVVVGILRPVVLLPAKADEWPEEGRRVVLLHELAHIQRGDMLAYLLAHLARACYWMNPLVWVAAYRMRVEREMACDDAVLGTNVRASEYAAHLLAIVQSATGSQPAHLSAVPMARRKGLSARIRRFFDERQNRTALTRGLIFTAILVMMITTIALAGLRQEQHGVTRQVSLPSGATVTLLGVTYSPFTGRSWWTADGTPLPKPLFSSAFDYSGASIDPHDTFRTIALRVDHLASNPDELKPEIRSFSYPEAIRESRRSSTSTLLFVDVQDANFGQPFTLHLRLRDRPWQTVVRQRRMARGGFEQEKFTIREGETISATLSSVELDHQRVEVTVKMVIPQHNYDGRLVVIGKDSKVMEPIGASYDAEGTGEYQYHCNAANIDEMRVEVRAIADVKFTKVALNPRGKRSTPPAPSLASAPLLTLDPAFGRSAFFPPESKGAFSIAADQHGRVYVLDAARKTVTGFTADGTVAKQWSVTQDYLSDQSSIAVDGTGQVYVFDGYQVRIFSAAGRLHRRWIALAKGDRSPDDSMGDTPFFYDAFTVGPTGEVFVAGQKYAGGNPMSAKLIRRFTPNGVLVKEWVFNSPDVWTDARSTYLRDHSGSTYGFHLHVDPTGNLYVVSSGGRYRNASNGDSTFGSDTDILLVKKYSHNGELLACWGGIDYQYSSHCAGIVVDAVGTVYLALGNGIDSATLHGFTSYQGYLRKVPIGSTAKMTLISNTLENRLALDGNDNVYLLSASAPYLRKYTGVPSYGSHSAIQ